MVDQTKQPFISLAEAIQKRSSIRAYTGEPLAAEHLALLKGIASNIPRLTDTSVRFEFLEGIERVERILTGLIGSYGKVKGAPVLIAGIAGAGPFQAESLGFSMEHLILEAARQSIGTCWISGTFDRQRVKDEISLAGGEEVLAVSPAGYAAPSRSAAFVKVLVGSNKRKPLSQIVFADAWGNSAEGLLTGRIDLQRAAEAVRWAPSAVNQQPWRLILTLSAAVLASVKPKNGLDNGIALAHWLIAARHEGLDGAWDLNPDHEALRKSLKLPAKAEVVGVYPL